MTVALRVAAGEHMPALLLRPWAADDLDRLVEAFRDPELRRWIINAATDVAAGLRWLAAEREGWVRRDRFGFAVLADGPAVPRVSSEVGGAALAGHAVIKTIDLAAGSAEVGYWTAAGARGRGVAPRALDAISGWAFDTLAGLDRLELFHQIDNHASCRVAEKAGFPLDRVLPACPPYPADGHLHVRRAPLSAGPRVQ